MKRNTLVLLAIGLLFGAYLIFVEARREIADEDSGEPAQKYVLEFPAEEAIATTIAFGEGPPTHVEKTAEGWRAWDERTPERYVADEDWVKDFLELVRGVQGAGVVEEGAVNLASYGFGEGDPYIEIRGQDSSGKEWTRRLELGDKSPVEEKFYVTNQDGRAVYLMDGYLKGQLDRGVANFRPRRPLSFDKSKVAGIEITHHAADPVVLRRSGGSWETDRDAQIDDGKVDALLGNLTHVTIAEFTFDKLADRAPEYGLDKPTQTIRLLDAEGSELAGLSIGDRIQATDYYASSTQMDEAFTLKPAFVSELPRTVEDFMPPPPEPAADTTAPAPPAESEDIEMPPPQLLGGDETDHAAPN